MDVQPDGRNSITHSVIGAAIEVHRCFGPGLLESAYLDAMCCELSHRALSFEREMEIPVRYNGQLPKSGYRIDLVVAGLIPVEPKAVEKLLPVRDARLLTYLQLLNMPLGLIINFNVPHLVTGVKRMANRF
ncbi:MAG: GxxExxY protein [Gemmatimonadales bacterium]